VTLYQAVTVVSNEVCFRHKYEVHECEADGGGGNGEGEPREECIRTDILY